MIKIINAVFCWVGVSLCLGVIIASLLMALYEYSYKMGQVDAMTGRQVYYPVNGKDGLVVWEKIGGAGE